MSRLFRDNKTYIMGEVANMTIASIGARKDLSDEQKEAFALALGVGERHILPLAERIDDRIKHGQTDVALVRMFNLLEALKGQPIGPTVQTTDTTRAVIGGMVDRMKEIYAPRVAQITPKIP